MARILIVDDKINLCKSLTLNFARFEHEPFYATNADDAIDVFLKQDVEAVVLDLKLAGDDGITLLRRFLALDNSVPVLILTGYGTIQTAVEAMKLGAYHYVEKPARFDELKVLVERAVRSRHNGNGNDDAPSSARSAHAQITTADPALKAVIARARKLAESEIPILIQGESGTGKELLANFIHACSPRSQRGLLRVNCAALPEGLLDNELFGHEKGAFTGAVDTFKGLFEQADGGTLFLDEIADMTLSSQARILRVIQNGELRRIGGARIINVDVRFIGATNRNVWDLVREGGFREDLFYRLSAATVTLPPLRERLCDVPILVQHVLEEFAAGHDAEPPTVTPPVMDRLMSYHWPGNVREMRNTLLYAATVATGSRIETDDLPGQLHPEFGNGLGDEPDIASTTRKEHLLWALEQTGNNKKRAAELLKISRKTLYNRMAKYGIEGKN